jgi:hypothetical protein
MCIDCDPTSFLYKRIVSKSSTHSPQSTNNCERLIEEANYCTLLLQRQGFILLTRVI